MKIITIHKFKGLKFQLVFLLFVANFRLQNRPFS
nr:hypothetical protein [Candidatus Gullanella endobia]